MKPALHLPTGHVKWQKNTLSRILQSMAFQDLSAFGQICFVYRILVLAAPVCLLDIVKASIRAVLQRLSLRSCIQNVIIRAFMTHIPPHQIQTILPSTVEVYRAWMASAGETPRIQILPDGNTRLLWLGLGKCPRILLFLHGISFFLFYENLPLVETRKTD